MALQHQDDCCFLALGCQFVGQDRLGPDPVFHNWHQCFDIAALVARSTNYVAYVAQLSPEVQPGVTSKNAGQKDENWK